MSYSLILFFGFVALLLAALGWALWQPRRQSSPQPEQQPPNAGGERHVTHLQQIHQVLSAEDFEFVRKSGSRTLNRRFRKERLRVVRAYLDAIRGDFENLMRMARVIAVMSPEVVAVEEFERMRLTATFRWRYQVLHWKLMAGFAPMAQMDNLSNLVSGLSVRMETAVRELGERAALAAGIGIRT